MPVDCPALAQEIAALVVQREQKNQQLIQLEQQAEAKANEIAVLDAQIFEKQILYSIECDPNGGGSGPPPGP